MHMLAVVAVHQTCCVNRVTVSTTELWKSLEHGKVSRWLDVLGSLDLIYGEKCL
jgi:hypothetical protein